MDWNVQLQKKHVVKFPASISKTEPMAVEINGKKHEVRWDAISQTLFLKTANGEAPIRIRGYSVRQFEGDQDSQVDIEWSSQGGRPVASTATVSPFSFFASDSTKRKGNKHNVVRSQMNGKIIKVEAKAGDTLKSGDLLCVIEAMKMENRILAPIAGELEKVSTKVGDAVTIGQELFRFK